MFHLTSKQNTSEYYHYIDLNGVPPILELIFIRPKEHVTEIIVEGNECLPLPLTFLAFLAKQFTMVSFVLEGALNCNPSFANRFFASLLSEYVPALVEKDIADTKTKPSNMQL